MRGSDFHFGEYLAQGGWSWKRPAQPDGELLIIASGRARLNVGQYEYRVDEGDALFLPPGYAGSISNSGDGDNLVFRFYHLPIDGSAMIRAWPCWRDAAAAMRQREPDVAEGYGATLFIPAHTPMDPGDSLLRAHDEIIGQARAKPPGYMIVIISRLILMLADISTAFREHLGDFRSRSSAVTRRERQVERAVEFIETHINDRISLSDVAGAIGLNPDYLGRLFRLVKGCSVGEFILRRKISIARTRLLSGALSVKETSASLGFSDSRFFSRQFRRCEGASPTEFLQRAADERYGSFRR